MTLSTPRVFRYADHNAGTTAFDRRRRERRSGSVDRRSLIVAARDEVERRTGAMDRRWFERRAVLDVRAEPRRGPMRPLENRPSRIGTRIDCYV